MSFCVLSLKNISSVFSCSIFYTNILLLLLVFNEAYCQDLVTQASLWQHNGNQDVTKEAAMAMVCGHAFQSGWFEAVLWVIFYLYTPESA